MGKFVDPERIRNKWPNDVQIDECKVAGLLLESSGDRLGNLDWVTIGCGVNIAVHPNLSDYETTSLNQAAKKEINIKEFMNQFLEYFEIRYDTWRELGIDPIREDWMTRASDIGRKIVVRLPQSDIKGIFEGLDPSGALILVKEDGVRELVTAGDIFAER